MKLPKIPSVVKAKFKKAFDKRGIFLISAFGVISKSLPLTWIIWDSLLSQKLYKHQKLLPHQFLRFLRLGVGIGWFIGAINPFVAGTIIALDGIYSILHYRINKVTKRGIEDVPRLTRIGMGLMMAAVIPLPFF